MARDDEKESAEAEGGVSPEEAAPEERPVGGTGQEPEGEDAFPETEAPAEEAGAQRAEEALDDGAPPEAAPGEGAGIGQDGLHALLEAGDADEVLAGHDEDALIVGDEGEPEEPVAPPRGPAGGKDSAADSTTPPLEPSEESPADSRGLGKQEVPGREEPDVSQEMVDALIAAAGGEGVPSEVGSENLAAAATTPSGESPILREDDLDEVIEEAKQSKETVPVMEAPPEELPPAEAAARSEAPQEAAPPEPAEETGQAPRRSKAKPRRVGATTQHNLLRIAIALAAAVLTGLGTFTVLYMNQEQMPDLAALTSGKIDALEMAMDRARGSIAAGDYASAVAALEDPIAHAQAGNQRTDARFLLLKARYEGFAYEPGAPAYEGLHQEIDELVKEFPTHPRAAEALYWKAKLYEVDELPYAAQDIYKQLIDNYPDAPSLPSILLDAALLANALRNPRVAAEYTQALIQRFPGSPLAGEARLVLGDAYLMAGMETDARTLFVRTAQAAPNSRLGAEAFLRLARLAFDQRQYLLAIQQLETRLETATTVEGNDQVYLLLAQAYRQVGRLEEARDTLNDLITFFPATEVTAVALVELSQVLDELGERKEALRVAQEAVARYPENAKALQNKGELLGLAGNAFGAAAALVAANEAGAHDPSLLLTAARHYRSLGMNQQARETYALLKDQYAFSAQALTGGIEGADLLYEMGEVNEAVKRLEDLARATEGKPQRLPALMALSRIYEDLGLDERVRELSELIATLSTEPQVLAQSVSALLDTGALEKAQELIQRLDLARVKEDTAYQLLTKLGKALLSVDPRRGMEKMEEAYFAYPQARNPEDEQQLLEVYLAANRPAAARRMVMELAARVRETPVQTPYLIDAAITWGDYCFAKGDFRTAADAYELALNVSEKSSRPVAGIKRDPRWAKYQRANALLELADYQGSLALLAEIANSDAPWAQEAGMKADYARLEQRLHQGKGLQPLVHQGTEGTVSQES